MASRSLRSRTVEAHEENQDLPAGEHDTRTLADDPLELGSESETPELCELQASSADIRQASPARETMVKQSEQTLTESVNSTTQLQQMLQDFFDSIKSDLNSTQIKLDQFQNSVKSDLNSLRSDLNEVKSDLSANQTKLDQFQSSVRSDLNGVKSDLQAHQEQVRADIQAENQKLLRNFEAQTQGLRQEFNQKLESENRRVSQLVSQVQSETAAELAAVKGQLQGMSTEFDARLDHSNANTQGLINELADQMQEHRSEVSVQMERQKESLEKLTEANTREVANQFDQMKAKFVEIESKLNVSAERQTLAPGASVVVHHSPPPSAAPTDGPTRTEAIETSSGTVDGTVSCNHPPTTGHTVTSHSGVNDCAEHANPTAEVSLSGYLTNSELPVPLFDDMSETNPVLHLRRLEEFFQFRNVPKSLWLTIACRSIIGHLSKQWIEAIAHRLADYEAFKEAFLNTWWSKTKQSLVKCTLYQTKYDRQSGLSLSAHFLKYLNLAAYLEPRPSEADLIEAVRVHYPISVQRTMLTNLLQTIEQALDLLRRVELMEQADHYQKPHQPIPNPDPSNQKRSGNNPTRNDQRGQNQAQVCQVQFSPSRNQSHGYRRRNRGNNNRG
jgi:exonuclease VII large subunit